MLGSEWHMDMFSLAREPLGGSVMKAQWPQAGQQQHEVQEQYCAFSLPKGDPQKLGGGQYKEQLTKCLSLLFCFIFACLFFNSAQAGVI